MNTPIALVSRSRCSRESKSNEGADPEALSADTCAVLDDMEDKDAADEGVAVAAKSCVALPAIIAVCWGVDDVDDWLDIAVLFTRSLDALNDVLDVALDACVTAVEVTAVAATDCDEELGAPALGELFNDD